MTMLDLLHKYINTCSPKIDDLLNELNKTSPNLIKELHNYLFWHSIIWIIGYVVSWTLIIFITVKVIGLILSDITKYRNRLIPDNKSFSEYANSFQSLKENVIGKLIAIANSGEITISEKLSRVYYLILFLYSVLFIAMFYTFPNKSIDMLISSITRKDLLLLEYLVEKYVK